MSDDLQGRGVGVTIKYGKGFEETWATFRGTLPEVREDITVFFGLDRASVAALTLDSIVLNATQVAHAKGNAGAKLGATAIGSSSSSTESAGPGPDAPGETGSDDPWATPATDATPEPDADPNALLRRAIEAETDVNALKLIWAENQQAFADDATLLDAWKAKGKALKAAA